MCQQHTAPIWLRISCLFTVDQLEATQLKNALGIDLNLLLEEIRQLRIQLVRTIENNNSLRAKLEEQLARSPRQSSTTTTTTTNTNTTSNINIHHVHATRNGRKFKLMWKCLHWWCVPSPHLSQAANSLFSENVPGLISVRPSAAVSRDGLVESCTCSPRGRGGHPLTPLIPTPWLCDRYHIVTWQVSRDGNGARLRSAWTLAFEDVKTHQCPGSWTSRGNYWLTLVFCV